MISISVAMSKNRVIGLNNQLPWHLPADLRRFKALTLNKTVIMGRKTFESIGRPLPQRENIIITRNPDFKVSEGKIAASLEEAILLAHSETIFIIGGESIYRQALPIVDQLFVTEIDVEVEGDTYFPEIDLTAWQEVERESHLADSKNRHSYDFVVYQRKR